MTTSLVTAAEAPGAGRRTAPRRPGTSARQAPQPGRRRLARPAAQQGVLDRRGPGRGDPADGGLAVAVHVRRPAPAASSPEHTTVPAGKALIRLRLPGLRRLRPDRLRRSRLDRGRRLRDAASPASSGCCSACRRLLRRLARRDPVPRSSTSCSASRSCSPRSCWRTGWSGPDSTGLLAVTVTLGVLGWTTAARVMRSSVISARNQDYVSAARMLGAGPCGSCSGTSCRTRWRRSSWSSRSCSGVNIASEATLSFLGVGLKGRRDQLGHRDRRRAVRTSRTDAGAAGLARRCSWRVTVLAFIMLGDAVRDAFDPKLR